ncbi:MAG: hypothetical protein SFX72_16085 [Isosphaeraceae bacterium]|nr:hypothetical protein [Isosphaeraceae bacterium]
MMRRCRLTRSIALLAAVVSFLPSSGCDEAAPPSKTVKKSKTAKPLPKDREILGKRTTEVVDAQKETASGAAKAVEPRKIVSRDPITLSGNAYVSIIGQASILQIKHAVDLYQAERGEYPKTYQEFMDGIIRANNIALPRLPIWQSYGYDAATHSLVIIEYPDRKAQVDAEYDAKAGRGAR